MPGQVVIGGKKPVVHAVGEGGVAQQRAAILGTQFDVCDVQRHRALQKKGQLDRPRQRGFHLAHIAVGQRLLNGGPRPCRPCGQAQHGTVGRRTQPFFTQRDAQPGAGLSATDARLDAQGLPWRGIDKLLNVNSMSGAKPQQALAVLLNQPKAG